MGLFYNNNANLKAIGVPVQYTPEQIQEYIKCKDDPIYFIEKYCKIISLDLGLIPFILFNYQKRFIIAIHDNNRVISMQPRQSGKTQVVAAYILHYSIFNSSKTVAILANKANAAREIMSRYQNMFESLPVFLQQGVKTYNKGDVELENGSKVFTGSTSSSGIRGRSVNFLYVDEVSIIPNSVADAFFTATYPTISAGKTSKIVLTSTPLGYNHFFRFWDEAERNINGFIPIRVDYSEHPDRDEEWANQQRELLGEVKFSQEILCSFIGSSYSLIPGDHLAKLSASTPLYTNENLDVFERPTKGRTYVMTVDIAKGIGGDYSIIQVLDISDLPYRQVAKYRNNTIAPLLFPNIIYKIGREFNNAYALIEINVSEQVPHILHYELEYENIMLVNKSMKGLNKGQIVGGGFGTKPQLGVNTDKKVKRIGCTNLKSLIMENKLLLRDADTINELSTFIEIGDSYAADDSYHDDLVMGLVIFAWLTTQQYFKELNNVNLRKMMYESQMMTIEEELTPFGFYDDGNESDEIPLLNF